MECFNLGQAPSLVGSVRSGCKNLQVPNTLAYLASSSVKKQKKFFFRLPPHQSRDYNINLILGIGIITTTNARIRFFLIKRCHDIQQNNIHHNNIQQNGFEQSDIQQNVIRQNNITVGLVSFCWVTFYRMSFYRMSFYRMSFC